MNPIQNGLKKASILGFGIYWLMRALCAKIAEEVEERIDPWGSANTYLNAQLKRESLYNSTRFFHHLKALFNKCSRCSSSQRERIILCCFLDWCAIYVLHQDIFLLHYSRCRLLSPRYIRILFCLETTYDLLHISNRKRGGVYEEVELSSTSRCELYAR